MVEGQKILIRGARPDNGEPIFVDFRVNGTKQGEEIARPKAIGATAHVIGTVPIREMQLIADDRIVARQRGEQREEEWEVALSSGTSPSYCYLKVIQEDLEAAWSSPVFLNDA